MRTEAAYITGAGKVSIREAELPELGDAEVLMRVVSSSMCYSTYKALMLGPAHKRVPANVAEVPVMTGHEFAGTVEQVGKRYADRFHVGQRIAIQPALGLESGYSPGYSYPYFGGDATLTIIPEFAIEKGCILPFEGNYFADASLAEPMSCIVGAFHASYHTQPYVYQHRMGLHPGGNLALLGCAGPMGFGAIDYAIHGPYQPQRIVVVDVDSARLARVESLLPPSPGRDGPEPGLPECAGARGSGDGDQGGGRR
jgi:threonine dehydrogenase-like Zn-dependent dehydrogenase